LLVVAIFRVFGRALIKKDLKIESYRDAGELFRTAAQYEVDDDEASAVELYERILSEYPDSEQARYAEVKLRNIGLSESS